MQILLLLILAFSANIFTHGIIPFLFEMIIARGSSYKKIKIFFLIFGLTLIFALLILFQIVFHKDFINVFVAGVLIIVYLIRIVTLNRNYLATFKIQEANLSIEYITLFLKTKEVELLLKDISEFEITKANWVFYNTSSINIKYEGIWITFQLIDEKLNDSIKRQIHATGIQLTYRV